MRLAHPIITLAGSHLAGHFRATFYANAYVLILNEVAAAGLGVLYWLFAARVYSAEVVGQSSAVISTLIFLATLSQFSLRSAMIRFVPRSGPKTARLILYAYGICLATAAIISAVFLFAGDRIPLTTGLIGDTNSGSAWFPLAIMAWCIFSVQGGVLIGMRRAVWVLIGNSVYNLAKIGSLVILFWIADENGIVASWFLPVPVIVLLVNGLVFWPFMSKHLEPTGTSVMPISLHRVASSVSFDHVGSLLAEATGRILPLLVLTLLGSGANAYFYQAWIIASALYLIVSSMASSFTVEAAANPSQIALYSRRTLIHSARLIVPMAAIMFMAAPPVLSLWGEAYAREGADLLRWLALAALPVIVNVWYLCYARVKGDLKSIVVIQGLLCVVTLGLSYWWLPTRGITSIGAAWLFAQTIVAMLIALKTMPVWLAHKPGHAIEASEVDLTRQ